MKRLLFLLTLISFYSIAFAIKPKEKASFTITITTNIKGKGGATGTSSGAHVCPDDAQAVCATITTTIVIGNAFPVPGDIIPLGGSTGTIIFPDETVRPVLINAPNLVNLDENGEVTIQGSLLTLTFLD